MTQKQIKQELKNYAIFTGRKIKDIPETEKQEFVKIFCECEQFEKDMYNEFFKI